jgi:hypothetical protein
MYHGTLMLLAHCSHKTIGPGQWDLSVAEHLSPGASAHSMLQAPELLDQIH